MKYLDNQHFIEMLQSASNNLENKYHEIDKLNVFPVPDGDTGTNMFMTFSNGVKAIKDSDNNHIGETAKKLSKAMLMNARGNSGVILSQIFKGIANIIADKKVANTKDISDGFINGSRMAYKAVMRPTEGTILTVAREASDYGMFFIDNNQECTFEEFFKYFYEQANESLQHTPELLPVLREVGVVDSGGAGIVTILEGISLYWEGKPVLLENDSLTNKKIVGFEVNAKVRLTSFNATFDFAAFFNSFDRICHDVKYSRQGNVLSFSLISSQPVEIISKMQQFGTFIDLEVHNLSKNNCSEVKTFEKKHEKFAFISVVNGIGIKKMFEDLRCKYFVTGGQTMNPSTQDFVKLIQEQIDADDIYILPNNKNIILAANQILEVINDMNIHIIGSTSIPEGINAIMNFNPNLPADKNIANMNEAMKNIKNGSITFAIKDTSINDIQIKAGNYIGIANKKIVISDPSIEETLKTTINNLIDDNTSFISIIYGKDVTEQQANNTAEYITNEFNIDVEVNDGGQDLYPYIFGVE